MRSLFLAKKRAQFPSTSVAILVSAMKKLGTDFCGVTWRTNQPQEQTSHCPTEFKPKKINFIM